MTKITRRAALIGAATLPAIALPGAAGETITERIDRLSQELSAAMGEFMDGSWTMTVRAGDNISLQPAAVGTAKYRARIHLANYRRALTEEDPSITGLYEVFCVDTGQMKYIAVDREARS